MVNGSPEINIAPKTPEVPKKRVGKKEVKGLYAHAAEHHKNMQAYERKWFVHKMLRGLVEPIAIHVRALRLDMAVKKYRAAHGEDPILTNDFVKEALKGWVFAKSGKISEQTIRQVQSLSEAHKEVIKSFSPDRSVGEHVEDLTPVEQKKARALLENIFAKNGQALTEDEVKKIAADSGISEEAVQNIAGKMSAVIVEAQKARIPFKTPEDMKNTVTDEVLYAGLSPEQKILAKKVARASIGMTATALLRYGGVALIAATPVGLAWGAAGVIGGVFIFGATASYGRLKQQEKLYEFNKGQGAVAHGPLAMGWTDKGLAMTKIIPAIGRLTSVNWEKEGRGRQLARAAIAGGLIAAAIKFAPQLESIGMHAEQTLGNVANDIGHASREVWGDISHTQLPHLDVHNPTPEVFSGKTTEIQIPHVTDGELRVPDGWHFGDVHHGQDPNVLYDTAGDKVASHFSSTNGITHFQYESVYASSHGIDMHHLNQSIDSSHPETDQFNEFVREHGSADLKINSPANDLPGHGKEAYGMTDYSDGKTLTIQSYDSLGEQSNSLEIKVNGQHLVFLPTDHINGHPAWQFTPGDTKDVVTMWKDGQELHVTSDQAASMLHITNGELQNWVHSGNPAGSSSDWDYNIGQNILGHDVIFGTLHKDTGVLDQLGVIRGHSGGEGELVGKTFGENVYDFTNKLGHIDVDEHLKSAAAVPFQRLDDRIDSIPFIGTLTEGIHDHTILSADDYIYYFQEHPFEAFVLTGLTPILIGAALANNRAKTRKGKLAKAAVATAAFLGFPGIAAAMGLGYVGKRAWDKLRGRKLAVGTPVPGNQNPEGIPAGGGTNGGTASSTVTTGPVAGAGSAGAGGDNTLGSIAQASPSIAATSVVSPSPAPVMTPVVRQPADPATTVPTPLAATVETEPSLATPAPAAPIIAPAGDQVLGGIQTDASGEIPSGTQAPLPPEETTEALEADTQIKPENQESNLLSEDDYLQRMSALQQQVQAGLGASEGEKTDIFQRLDDALLVGQGYVRRDGQMVRYNNTTELLDLVAKDFMLSEEGKEALAEYINQGNVLREHAAYTAVIEFAGLGQEELPFATYEILRGNGQTDKIDKLYESLTVADSDEKKQEIIEQIDIALATYFKLGIPFTSHPGSLYQYGLQSLEQAVFGTDFVSTTPFPWVNHGEGPTSSQDDNIRDALRNRLQEAGGDVADSSLEDVYHSLDQETRQKVLEGVSDRITEQYKDTLATNGQAHDSARIMLQHMLAAYMVKEEDVHRYPMRERPHLML